MRRTALIALLWPLLVTSFRPAFIKHHKLSMAQALRSASPPLASEAGWLDKGVPLRKTGADGGIAKTAATQQLGAQLQAQSNVRKRWQQGGSFKGTIELIMRPGCANCERVRSTLINIGMPAEQLAVVDVDAEVDSTTSDVGERLRFARAHGVPQVHVLKEGSAAERIDNFWMEIGSGALVRRLAA